MERPIEQRNTGKGKPGAIVHADRPLNHRQQVLLDMLPTDGSQAKVAKKRVNMADLAALTAETGDEFALLAKGGTRLVPRGNESRIELSEALIDVLTREGYRWSGHTHPGIDGHSLISSPGDQSVIRLFPCQERGQILNSLGHRDYVWQED
jgi:hypothetical protein